MTGFTFECSILIGRTDLPRRREQRAAHAPAGVVKVIRPAFPLEPPPQAMWREQADLSAPAAYLHGVMPGSGLENARRNLEVANVARHITRPAPAAAPRKPALRS